MTGRLAIVLLFFASHPFSRRKQCLSVICVGRLYEKMSCRRLKLNNKWKFLYRKLFPVFLPSSLFIIYYFRRCRCV